MWSLFLSSWNGREFFLPEQIVRLYDMDFYTDASGNIGFGFFSSGKLVL